VRKYGAIDDLLTYAGGTITMKARCRVRVEVMCLSDSPKPRWSLLKLVLPEASDLHMATVEDQRVVTAPIDFTGSGRLIQTVAISTFDVAPNDVLRAYITSKTNDATPVAYNHWLNLTLVP
jgi:hypothetical protein